MKKIMIIAAGIVLTVGAAALTADKLAEGTTCTPTSCEEGMEACPMPCCDDSCCME